LAKDNVLLIEARLRGTLVKDFDAAKKKITSFSIVGRRALNALALSVVSLKGVFAAVIAGVVVSSISRMISSVTELGATLLDTSQKFGIAVEDLSELAFAAEANGINIAALATGLRRFNRNIADTAAGGKLARGRFEELGISIRNTDGSLRDANDLFLDAAEGIAEMGDGARKTSVAFDLFGLSGANMIPLLNQGREGVLALRKEAQDLGIVFDEFSAEKAVQFQDSVFRIKKAAEGIFQGFVLDIAPKLTVFFQVLTALIIQNKKRIDEGRGSILKMGESFISTSGAIKIMVVSFAALLDLLNGGRVILGLTRLLLAGIGQAIVITNVATRKLTLIFELLAEKAKKGAPDLARFEQANREMAASVAAAGEMFQGAKDDFDNLAVSLGDKTNVQRAIDNFDKIERMVERVRKALALMKGGTGKPGADVTPPPINPFENFDFDAAEKAFIEGTNQVLAQVQILRSKGATKEIAIVTEASRREIAIRMQMVEESKLDFDAFQKFKVAKEQQTADKITEILRDSAISSSGFLGGIRFELTEIAKALNDTFTRGRQVASQFIGGAEQATATLFKSLLDGQGTFNTKVEEMTKRVEEAEKALQKLQESGTSTAAEIATATTELDGASEALKQFETNANRAKSAFKDFTVSVLKNIKEIIAQQIAKEAIKGVVSLATSIVTGVGGGGGGGQSVPRLAAGGIIDRPTLATVGEGGNAEAVVPLPDNRSIPVKFKGLSGAGSPDSPPSNVNITFEIATIDASDFDSLLTSRQEVIEDMVMRGIQSKQDFRQAINVR